ncbi:MAG: AIR synthase-related protein, partial [Bacteroidota bacterium]
AYIVGRILKPEPRADITTWLQENDITPTSMIDISDGLSSEALHICTQSNVGCVIYEEKIPIHEEAIEMAMEFGMVPVTCALSGGEDYELLFTVKQEDYEKVVKNEQISVIGYITDAVEKAHLLTKAGSKHMITAQGWDSFQQ